MSKDATSQINYLKKFKNPPFSDTVLESHIKHIFKKSFSNVNVTLNCFRGSGKPFELRYLLSNYTSIPDAPSNRYYVWLDLQSYLEDPSTALRTSLTFLATYFGLNLNDDIKKLLMPLSSEPNLNLGEYVSFLQYLALQEDSFITFVIENFRLVYSAGEIDRELYALISTLQKFNSRHTSFILLNDREYNKKNLEDLGNLKALFESNIVWGNDSLFDKDCIKQSFDNHSKLYNKKFKDTFIEKVSELAYGDPTTTKRIIMQSLGDSEYEEKFVGMDSIGEVYTLVGEDWFNSRYVQLLTNLEKVNVEALVNSKYKNTSEFLVKTGVLVGKEGNYEPMNKFLNHFIMYYGKDLLEGTVWTAAIIQAPSEYLSGQELIAFTLFNKHEDEIVTKEVLAEVIWGDAWETRYSDWALDKLISNLRKKLEKHSYPKQLKSVKGRGVILS